MTKIHVKNQKSKLIANIFYSSWVSKDNPMLLLKSSWQSVVHGDSYKHKLLWPFHQVPFFFLLSFKEKLALHCCTMMVTHCCKWNILMSQEELKYMCLESSFMMTGNGAIAGKGLYPFKNTVAHTFKYLWHNKEELLLAAGIVDV